MMSPVSRARGDVQAGDAGLHISKTYIGVQVRRRGWTAVPELLLDLAEIAGFLQQVHRDGVPGAVNRKLLRQARHLDCPLPDTLQALVVPFGRLCA